MHKKKHKKHKKQCRNCIFVTDALYNRHDGMCITQIFAKPHKTVWDNIPCKFYKEAPPTKEVSFMGIKQTMVWDSDFGGYVEQEEPYKPDKDLHRPFSKEYNDIWEKLRNKEISFSEMMMKVKDMKIYADEEEPD